MNKTWDVVIIGSGLAGYVAANYLGRSSLRVLLIEKSKFYGGRAKTDLIQKQNFNLGPHALYKRGAAMPILDDLGIQLDGSSPKTGGWLINEDQIYKAPFSPLSIFSTNLLSWRERVAWIRVILKISKTNIENMDDITFKEWVLKTSNVMTIQTLLYTLARLATYCDAPDKASAKVILTHLQRVLSGVLYVDYGWQTIIDQLHNQAITHGVQIKKQSTVKQIFVEENNSFTLTLTNDVIHAKQVLYTGDPHHLNHLLMNTTLDSFLDEIIPVKAATLDVALRKLPQPNNSFTLRMDQPYYYSLHSRYAKLSEERNSHILHVLKYHKPEENVDFKTIKQELENFLERIQPGWRNYEITSRFLPNITVSQRLPLVGDEDMLRNSKTAIRNLFIAGDWASPYSILSDAAIATGKQSAKEMMGELDAN
ncbi:phytoene desaturase family protein [Ornithinibacillus salinisoli]|uniref:Phytoene desaturase family protein n=1 Tax=Ornithinibacillus salinisoli TaxID=1848459 RepID=A0ABW4VWL9_9BACI